MHNPQTRRRLKECAHARCRDTPQVAGRPGPAIMVRFVSRCGLDQKRRPERSKYSTPIHVTLVWDGWPGVAQRRQVWRAARGAGGRAATRVPLRYEQLQPPLSPAVYASVADRRRCQVHESNFVCRHDTAACRPSRYDLGSAPVARDLRNAENLATVSTVSVPKVTFHTPPDSPRRRVRQDSHRSDSP